MVTDGAAVMSRVANFSVSPDLHVPHEIWMRCLTHLLNNSMKAVMSHCSTSDILLPVIQDFHAMKKTIKDANRAEWDNLLPSELKLK